MEGFGEVSRAVSLLLWLVLAIGVMFRVVTLRTIERRLAAMVVVPVLAGMAVGYGGEAWAEMTWLGHIILVTALLVGGVVVLVHLLWPGLGTAIAGHFVYDVLRTAFRWMGRLLVWLVATPVRLLVALVLRLIRPFWA